MARDEKSGAGEVQDARDRRAWPMAGGGRTEPAKGVGGSKGMLSGRLQMLADMVTPGNRLVDVGCDHGYLSISLVGSGICPGAIALDVQEGPLAAAKAHIKESGLEGYIEARLSDGLAGCGLGEADTLVCAGMGGRLMGRILMEGMGKARGMKELILQPQSELPQFRAFLREAGFNVVDEDAVFEDGKYYFAMKAVQDGGDEEGGEIPPSSPVYGSGASSVAAGADGSRRLYDLYGKLLLQKRHPILLQYLNQRENYVWKLEQSLADAGTAKAGRRLEEVIRELEDIQAALKFYFGRE